MGDDSHHHKPQRRRGTESYFLTIIFLCLYASVVRPRVNDVDG